jgi:hypothetical protein|tara:strand:+ start:624 stop:806 length:183 start_codon:yes stop_codon:yes gene_type:complete
MATKQEVADFINDQDIQEDLSIEENAYIQERIDPKLADILIKIVGDVSWLVEIRDNLPRE